MTIKPIITRVFTFFTLILTLFITGCDEPDNSGKTKECERTILMYYPWSTDLTNYFYNNISDMETAIEQRGLTDERVIVFISTSPTEATMFEITLKNKNCKRKTLKNYTEPAITTETGITGILNDVKLYAPAKKYSMIIGCHGMGWLPVSGSRSRFHETQPFHWEYNGSELTRFFGGKTPEFQTDVTTLAAGITGAGIKMEYILFDDCYMSTIEVAYDLRNVTNYLIASPTEIMAVGMPYATLGQYLLGDPDYKSICNEFYRFYSNYRSPYGTLGVTDCSQLEPLAAIMLEINSKYQFDKTDNKHLQRMDGYSPAIFYDFGNYATTLCADDTELRKRFYDQLDKTIPYKTHTRSFYSAAMGPIAIFAYSGITTSEPSINDKTATYTSTSWYAATHP